MNCKVIAKNKVVLKLKTRVCAAALCMTVLPSLCLTGCANMLSSQNIDAPDNALTDSSTTGSATASSTNFTVVNTGFFDVSVTYLNAANMFTNRDKEIGYDDSSAALVSLADNASSCSDKNASINDNIVTISKEGTYILSGDLSDGRIVVDANDTDKVQLVLDNVDIHCNSGAAIYIKNADKVFVTLASGSVNNLSSGEFTSIDDNKIDGTIFAKSDLTINGNGSLTVKSPYGHGIVSKDDLKITGGTYHITAASSALSGKDSVRIADGVFSLYAGKDGIHSENSDDADRGFIYIGGGNFTIECDSDGLDASSTLQIDGGTFSLSVDDDGFHSDSDLIINDGNVTINKCSEGLEGQTITINGGNITLDSQDDGINAADGSASGDLGGFDDFKNKDGAAPKDFGGREMPSDPEGFDNFKKKDGTNPKNFGGREMPSDPEEFDGFGKRNGGRAQGGSPFMANNGCLILINGGTLHITANGDGIDSNGNLAVTGGEIYVSGPTNDGNSALDYDGSALITGGIVVAAGSFGMAQNFSEDSTQGSILVMLSSPAAAGDTIVLADSEGKKLLSYTPEKTYSCVVVSCPEITQDGTYTLTAGSQNQNITMNGLVYGNYRRMR